MYFNFNPDECKTIWARKIYLRGSETENAKTETTFIDTVRKETITYNITNPSLTVYLPNKNNATGTGIVIIPGGAFHILAAENEGTNVAKYLAERGIAAFVLKPRLIEIKTNNPFQEIRAKMQNNDLMSQEVQKILPLATDDATLAIKYIQENLEKFNLTKNQIGMMGFSAGGTIALSTTYFSDLKPNFLMLIYPYVDVFEKMQKKTPENTPLFMTLAANDEFGFVPANANMYLDWFKTNKNSELHIYDKGGHGFGMFKKNIPTDNWTERLTDWMKMNGYLKLKNPPEWQKKFTEAQLAEMDKEYHDQVKRDWTNFRKYRKQNVELKTKKKPKAVLIGDSITEGWVNADKDFFDKNNLVSRGISGQTSPQIVLRFRQDVLELKPECAVLNIGINDIAENTGDYSEKFVLDNYKTIVEIAKANNLKLILASVLPAYSFPWRPALKDIPSKVMSLNKGLKKIADDNHLIYLDYFEVLKDDRNGLSAENATDGVHPTLKCYKEMEKNGKCGHRKMSEIEMKIL